jgi:2-methylcitrate dehydratase PrpD
MTGDIPGSTASSLSFELARHVLRPVPPSTLERAALHVLDWTGCAAVGAATPTARAIRAGSGLLQMDDDPWQPLLHDGAVGNILEMDDIHRAALVHPGPVVIPAALFVARRLKRSGRAFLEAVVRGYEAMIRLGEAVGPAHYRYWHPTATCGSVGAATAAFSLLQSPDGTVAAQPSSLTGGSPARHADARTGTLGHALGLALTRSAGLWQVRLESNMAKAWHNAHAAQTGVQAAMLACGGVTAPMRMLEGEKGFFAALCPDARPDALLAGPDGPWKITETSFKPWPSCRHTHPAIDAALQLRERITDIRQVRIQTYSDALAFCDNPAPQDEQQARFSLQHAVAVALLHGEPAFTHFSPEALVNDDIAALRRRMSVSASNAISARYPAHFGASLDIECTDGSVLHHAVSDALGDPERPLAASAIERKARDCMAQAGWTTQAMDEAVARVNDMASAASLEGWTWHGAGRPGPVRA